MQTVIAEDLSTLAEEDLKAVEAELIAEFDGLVDAGSNDLAAMTEIADALDRVRGEVLTRETAAAEAAEKVAALTERIRPSETEIVAEEGTEEPEEAPEAEEAEAEVEQKELVTASADQTPKAPSAAAVVRRAAQPEVAKAAPTVSITAAADIPGFTSGSSLDKIALAKAMHAKARTLSNHSGYVPVAQIQKPIEHKMTDNMAHNIEVLEEATKPSALTAAGWCAPSQNLYSFLSIEGRNGLFDLPTVQVSRGGINVPAYVDYSETVDALWSWTEEDQDNPEASKPCLRIPCPEFTDYRLAAYGLCLTNGNLTDRAFPELTARFLDLTLTAHMHRMSALQVAAVAGTATGVTVGAVPTSAAGSILHAIDLQVVDYRSTYLMPVDAVLEAVFPVWVKELIRADFAMRDAAGYSNVTDAMIEDHFAARKVRVQFVQDYGSIVSMGPRTAFPTTMDFLLYPAGGYVLGDGGVIDLGIVRDSVLNATNDYTAAWTEQLWLVAQMGPAAREVTVNFSVDGVTGCCPAPEAGGEG